MAAVIWELVLPGRMSLVTTSLAMCAAVSTSAWRPVSGFSTVAVEPTTKVCAAVAMYPAQSKGVLSAVSLGGPQSGFKTHKS